MRAVSDQFLLGLAEVSGALVGLFLVGVIFFAETGFRGPGARDEDVRAYFRASTKIVLILFAFPLGLSLTLVVLSDTWNAVVFALLSLALVAVNIETATLMRGMRARLRSRALLWNESAGTVGVVLLVALPWILGGIDPTREDLTWSILIAFAIGFSSLLALMMSVFDLADAPARAGD